MQWMIWLSYEYLRTLGFLGYPYGITAYSQWRMIPLIQSASITGVWGVSALVTFPSFLLAAVFVNFKREDILSSGQIGETIRIYIRRFFLAARNYKVPAIIWCAALAASLVFGFVNIKDFSSYPAAQIALIQHNTDPWEPARAPAPFLITEGYRKDLASLIRLSDEALASHPKPQLVVWPETAFVPRIYWHLTYRDDQNSWGIVKDLLDYLSEQDVPFLIGNDDARMEPAKNPDQAKRHRVDYNAAMLFERGQITASYRKLHLVPFTEHFPYKKQFPGIYAWLEKADTQFWEKGDEKTIFAGPGFTFAAPICFEDTFGYLSRDFVRRGADVLVNLSNDAWAQSLTAQYQHLTMAVFRAAENHRSMVRSTTSGQSCAINPNGKITKMAEPFKETWLNVSVPIVDRNKITFYTLYGDYLAVFFTALAAISLLLGAVWYTMRKLKALKGQL